MTYSVHDEVPATTVPHFPNFGLVKSNDESSCASPRILGKIGHLQARLARTPEEIDAAQKLRYNVFVKEIGARLPHEAMIMERDIDSFDANCDHLLVIDTQIKGDIYAQLIGTYRLMRQDMAEKHNGFYSQNEYDVASLVKQHQDKSFLELGRSCVLPQYRTRRSIELLWQGIWAYVRENNIQAMFGCASFMGTIPAAHAQAMSFLYHFCRASDEWCVKAHDQNARLMDMMPKEAVSTRQALMSLPPLIKGYLRVGAEISPQAVIDYEFGTTDVLVVLPISQINSRYINHYGAEAERFAA